ncbi:MAG: M23 family metallopeptidase [Candidatus Cloacimonetes bacterium]|nr:M23 family metallopeptidase [Candidatus Cloacimonadota bacterium]
MIKLIKIIILFCVLLIFLSCTEKVQEETIYQTIIEEIEVQKFDIFIPRGGSLFSEMTKLGLTPNQIVELTLVFGDNVDFRAIMPNDHFQLIINPESKEVIEFNFFPDIVTTHRIVRNSNSGDYEYFFEEKEITLRKVIVEGVVYTTFVNAMAENNIEANIRYSVANALSARINFGAHTRAGDSYRIMYEERLYDDNRVQPSRLYYMSYNGRATGFHEGFRYQEDDERSVFNGLYTPQGLAMVTANFRHPLDRIHVTSPFGMRFHPITRRWQMHNGVDYRASQGTPVYAVQAGRVIMARWNGGYGNTVEIQHDNNHVTQYAHMHRINVRQGQRVNSGTVVGLVGSTGVSTGPHLHFGLRVAGRWVNPSQLRMVSATRLEGTRLADFNGQMDIIRETLQIIENESISPFEMTPIERYRRSNARVL